MATDAGPHESREISNRLYRPIVFEEPDRLVDPASWVEHIPFAFWLVEAHRPEVFVELGTHSGNSYSAFAQGVQKLRLPTACYAIDTWKGDPQAGHYDESVFTEWRDYHERHFSAFSRLIRASFTEAVEHFANESIDLLHIDGYHTFDAVEQDFRTWLPRMSRRGVVLLHDTNVREGDFGAWRLWQRLERTYASFAFLHGHGLGVLGIGNELPEPVCWLLSAGGSTQAAEIRQFFARAGRQLSQMHLEPTQRDQTLFELQARLQDEQAHRAEAERKLEAGRQDGRVRRDERMQELEARLESERARREQTVRELETRLQDERARRVRTVRTLEFRMHQECARRDETIAQLDAEVRALSARLPAEGSRAAGRGDPIRRRAAAVARRLARRRDSRIWRSGLALLHLPKVAAMAMSSGGKGGAARPLRWFAGQPRRLRDASIILRSGLFDKAYYDRCHPDVANSGMHPLIHYVLWGAFERRLPHPLFDPAYYLDRNPDVARAGLEPLSHFLTHGGSEERSPGPHFDSRYYLASNPDVRAAGMNPLLHFVRLGWREGRNPSSSFDCADYLARYEDVRAMDMNPLIHYVEIGSGEGRNASHPPPSPLPSPPRVRLASTPIPDKRPDRAVIVCLTHVCPWPPHAGNAYRIYRLLRRLQGDGFRIVPIIVPLGGETPDEESIRKVEELFTNVVLVDRNGQIRYSLEDVPDVLASLEGEYTPRYSALLGEEESLSGRERDLLMTDRTYCPDAAIAAVLRLHSVLGRYVLLTEYVWMTRVLPLIDDRAVKVLDTIDVFSTKAEKVLRFGIQDLWMEPEEEARRLSLADLVIAIQQEERELLQRLAPNTRVVTAGIDFEVTGDPRLPSARRVLYVGSGNPMNVRGLTEFLRFAWPAVRQRVPDAELVVAGAVSETIAEPPAGVRLLGRVDDLDELYRNALVVINPALAGTGIKIKTVEALSRLRPIVTWPTGVDGLPKELRDLCDVVQDWYEFGPRVVARLLTDRGEAFSAAEQRTIARATSHDAVYVELSAALHDLWEHRAGSEVRARASGT